MKRSAAPERSRGETAARPTARRRVPVISKRRNGGLKCPYCGEDNDRVLDSRPAEDGSKIRRRRECLACKKRFTTYEVVESLPLIVIKKDGTREAFDRGKMLGGMLRACEKRAVPLEKLETAATEIETSLQNSLEREVTSGAIGSLVMEKLKEIDEVAYVRFASVYRRFKDVSSFMTEIQSLLGPDGGEAGE